MDILSKNIDITNDVKYNKYKNMSVIDCEYAFWAQGELC
jgi:hypothetical protein